MKFERIVAVILSVCSALPALAALPEGWVEGADITVDTTVLLDEATPELNSLTVASGGTLVFTNWTTRLWAKTVTIRSGGIVTCEGPFADHVTTLHPEIQMSNRVWIACTDFALESGGKIQVDEKGFGSMSKASNVRHSYGPGRALRTYGGASYGGRAIGGSRVYGSAERPVDPGSSGMGGTGSMAGIAYPGGGAVLIEATGAATVNGTISANGRTGYGNYGGSGSGGAICIECGTFRSASGALSACGGNRNVASSLPGAGGRIAIRYAAAEVSALSVSAAEGYLVSKDRFVENTKYADVGTVWLSDTSFFDKLGTDLSGEFIFANRTSATLAAIKVTNGHVRLGRDLKNLNVTGDIEVVGRTARLDFGAADSDGEMSNSDQGLLTSDCSDFFTYFSDATPYALAVGGSLKVLDGARFDAYSAPTNGLGAAAGGTITVADMLTVDSTVEGVTSVVYTCSNPTNGASFLWIANNATIGARGWLSADGRGFGSKNTNQSSGYGPGRGCGGTSATSCYGGGHGGAAYRHSAAYGNTYDLDPTFGAARPALAGSGAGFGHSTTYPGSGGGYIHLVCSRQLTLDGRITADGRSSSNSRAAAGSGGGILVETKKYAASESAVLSAVGGSCTQNLGAAGGGRIAFWSGALWQEGINPSQVTISESKPSDFPVNVSVAGGKSTVSSVNYFAEDGTIRYVQVPSSSGFIMLIKFK